VEFAVQRAILLPAFKDMARIAAVQNVERAVKALQGELDRLNAFAAVWASREEGVRFMVDRVAAHIDLNLEKEILKSLKAEFMRHKVDGSVKSQKPFQRELYFSCSFETKNGLHLMQ